MPKLEPPDSTNVQIFDESEPAPPPPEIKLLNVSSLPKEEDNKLEYIQDLKDMIWDELMERIEKKMDLEALDILDAARVKLKKLTLDSRMILFLFKPIFLIFLVEVYLGVQVNI